MNNKVQVSTRTSVSRMKPQSAQGWVHSVPRGYVHLSLLQAIDNNEVVFYQKITKYQISPMNPLEKRLFSA
jgi:hypothetical protein